MQTLTLRQIVIYGLLIFVVVGGFIWLITGLREQARREPRSGNEKAPEWKEMQEKIAKLEGLRDHATNAADSKGKDGRKDPNGSDREDRKARAKARLLAVRGRAKEIQAALDALDREISTWETKLPDWLGGEQGKRLAISRSGVEQFAAIYERPRLSREAARSLREQLTVLLEPVEAPALAEETIYMPSDGLVQDVDKIFQSAREAVREYEQARLAIETLVVDSSKSEPGGITLQRALQDHHAEQARERAAKIAAARKTGHEEATRQIAAAEESAAKELAQVELQRLAVRQAQEKVKREQALAAERQELERKRLEARFEVALPEIKVLLRAFTAEGYTQPKGIGQFVRTTNKGPV